MGSIIREALANASPFVRALVWRILGFCLLALLLQTWDSRDGEGAAGIAEFTSVVVGVTGIGLLGLTHSLHLVMQEAAARTMPVDDAPGVQRVLLAIPAVGFIAGVALGSAALLMGVRGVLGAEWPLVFLGVVLYSGLTLLAGRVVMGSVHTLFDFATLQAELAASSRTAAAAARIEALQARMNPHMLFNALNTVASLVRSNPAAAERVVEDLSDVLRMGLDRSTQALTTVDAEVAYVTACLAIDRERWGDALTVRWSVSDDIRDCLVPTFLVQPLVENALKHGLGGRLQGGTIGIHVESTGSDLQIIVEDDGAGFPSAWEEGVGLGNLRQRLLAMYGSRASLTIDTPDVGARVHVRLPLTRSDA
jgi:signal transduction histidine kinase